MWDNLADNSGLNKVLPSDRNWVLKEQKFDGEFVKLSFESLKQKEAYQVEFRPIHWSISDEWVEYYSDLKKNDDSQIKLTDLIKNIGKTFPDQVEDYNAVKSYFISAMEWNIRVISNYEPTVTRIG